MSTTRLSTVRYYTHKECLDATVELIYMYRTVPTPDVYILECTELLLI